jgi:predicted HTH domain antitoxin
MAVFQADYGSASSSSYPIGYLEGDGVQGLDVLGDFKLLVAIERYDRRQVSQSRAAELAGISRVDFLRALGEAKIDAIQYTADEAFEEAMRG